MAKLSKREFDKQFAETRKKIHDIAPFKKDTAAKKKARKLRCKKDIFAFADEYLPHYFFDVTPEFMSEWDTHSRIKNELGLVAAPRGCSKSTFFSFLRTLHDIAFKLCPLTIIGGDTGEMSERQLSLIKLELEGNSRFINDFGRQRNPGSWADGEFTTKSGMMVVAVGKGEGIRGIKNGPHRPLRFVGDDIENDEEQKNKKRVKKTVNWIKGVIIPALDPAGWTATIVGNVLSKKSALKQLIDEKHPVTSKSLYPSLFYSILDKADHSIWPERFSDEYLADLKITIGSIMFNKEFMNKPQDEDGIFKAGWITEWPDHIHDLHRPSAISIYLDPSMGASQKHDMKATIAVARVGENIDVLAARVRNESIKAMIVGYFDIYENLLDRFPGVPFKLFYEDNGFQKLLLPYFVKEAKKRNLPVAITGVDNRVNKELRIETLSPQIENFDIRFKKGNTDQHILIEQLEDYGQPQVKDDGPDALEGSVRKLAEVKTTQGKYTGMTARATAALAGMGAGRRAIYAEAR